MGKYLRARQSNYIGCAVTGCSKDCCVELVAMRKDGSRIYIPACQKHISQAHTAKRDLESGKEPREVRVQVQVKGEKVLKPLSLCELFYRAPGEQIKHRSEEEQEILDKARVVKKWKWVEDFDMWMNAAGKTVPLKDLEYKELEDSALLIRRVNIQRRTKKIQWITELEKIAPPIQYAYPEDELEVGMEMAYAKLDEFYEEYRSRGVLP